MLQIDRIKDCSEWLQLAADDYTGNQSITWFIDQLGQLCKSLAFVNEQMAEAKQALNKKKVTAYESLVTSSVANQEYFAPSLAKDYISAKCEKEQYDFDLTERCSRTLTHTIEAIRSILSALKEEMKIESYSQSVPQH
jgi:gas vesicle protein